LAKGNIATYGMPSQNEIKDKQNKKEQGSAKDSDLESQLRMSPSREFIKTL